MLKLVACRMTVEWWRQLCPHNMTESVKSSPGPNNTARLNSMDRVTPLSYFTSSDVLYKFVNYIYWITLGEGTGRHNTVYFTGYMVRP